MTEVDEDKAPESQTRGSAGGGTHAALWSIVAVALVVMVAVVGWLIVGSRARGSGTSMPLASVSAVPSPGKSAAAPSQWSVAVLTRSTFAYARPNKLSSARVRVPAESRYGTTTVLLVRRVVQAGGRVWYDVSLPLPPNGRHGWIVSDAAAVYAVDSKIVISRSERLLRVIRGGDPIAVYSVAVGSGSLPTPTGHFYVTAKLRPLNPGGAYGVLALAVNAFQPKLSYWADKGQIAIHGTNQPNLIGQPVSHGCVRMTNHDVLEVARLVRIGSPIDIIP